MSHITVPGRTGGWPLIGSVTVERKLLQHQGVELTRNSPASVKQKDADVYLYLHIH
jgi:hypothetical protein